jgi:hypothetical protein
MKPFNPYAAPKAPVRAADAQVEGGLQAGLLALALFILSLLWRLPDPWWLVGLAAFVPMLPVQSAVNEINARLAPQAEEL